MNTPRRPTGMSYEQRIIHEMRECEELLFGVLDRLHPEWSAQLDQLEKDLAGDDGMSELVENTLLTEPTANVPKSIAEAISGTFLWAIDLGPNEPMDVIRFRHPDDDALIQSIVLAWWGMFIEYLPQT